LEERPREQREILDAYLAAGRGVEAAHRAGIVHRDFKPDNVLVGDDGRVRVTDFGIARWTAPASTAPEGDAAGASSGLPTLTAPGALIGTPFYMAPEQHEGGAADARADQFAFCVALHEALYGRRPFAGETYFELCANVVAGRVREPPPE